MVLQEPAPILRISGYMISQRALSYFPEELTDRMKHWYGEHATMSDKELFIALEGEFGNDIVQQVCVPHGLTQGGCLVAAIYLLRGNS